MAAKLKTPEGKAIYRQRARTVERCLGSSSGVGLPPIFAPWFAQSDREWNLVCLAYNLKRLHRLGAGLKLTPAS